jgi:hypothetical protein
MQTISFSLNISAEKYLHYYKGRAHSVMVVADDGRRLKFPASSLQKFITRDGIRGRFEIDIDRNNRITAFRKVG